jgi:hypothetical protein
MNRNSATKDRFHETVKANIVASDVKEVSFSFKVVKINCGRFC